MQQSPLKKILAFLLIGFFIAGPALSADDIKIRMKNRLPTILEHATQPLSIHFMRVVFHLLFLMN